MSNILYFIMSFISIIGIILILKRLNELRLQKRPIEPEKVKKIEKEIIIKEIPPKQVSLTIY